MTESGSLQDRRSRRGGRAGSFPFAFLVVAVAGLSIVGPGCANRDARRAFARYEQAVDPLLKKDADLQARFLDQAKNLQAYGVDGGASLQKLFGSDALPFYRHMQKELAAIRPGTKRLSQIHRILEHYVALEVRLFEDSEKMNAAAARIRKTAKAPFEDVASKELDAESKAKSYEMALQDSPQLAQEFQPVLGKESQLRQQLLGQIGTLASGHIQASEFDHFVDRVYLARYDQVEKGTAAIDRQDLAAADVSKKIYAYVGAMRSLIASAKKLASDLDPDVQERRRLMKSMVSVQQDAQAARKKYLREASSYRKSLG